MCWSDPREIPKLSRGKEDSFIVNFNDARDYYTASKRLFVDFCERLRAVLVPIMEYAQRKHDGLLHTYFFQFRGKIKESTDDINKKIARLRLGQPYSNDARDKKMYGFFKKFLTLVAEYVDINTLVAVGRVVNTLIGPVVPYPSQ